MYATTSKRALERLEAMREKKKSKGKYEDVDVLDMAISAIQNAPEIHKYKYSCDVYGSITGRRIVRVYAATPAMATELGEEMVMQIPGVHGVAGHEECELID